MRRSAKDVARRKIGAIMQDQCIHRFLAFELHIADDNHAVARTHRDPRDPG
jgi:hypothetical protein